MSRSSDAHATGELDARHLDLLRRYRDAMRHLLSLSRAEYAPRAGDEEDEEEANADRHNKNEDENSNDEFVSQLGPPLTTNSVLYARTVVATTRRAFSWAVPTREALETIERHGGDYIIEVGAGTGFWTCLLRARGNVRRIDAVDLAPCDGPEHNGHHAIRRVSRSDLNDASTSSSANPPPFARVKLGTPEDVLGTGTNPKSSALFLCWPPREKPPCGEGIDGIDDGTPEEVSAMAMRALERFDGDAVLYVGEAPDFRDQSHERGEFESRGATAGPAFHAKLFKEWRQVESVPLPRWPGASDSLTVWRRRAEPTSPPRATGTDGSNEAARDPATAFETFATRETRRALLLEAREAWESATVAGIAARASRGGARAMRGAEQIALRAVRERSGLFRRLALAFL